jgi:hypothetical protein
VGLRPGDGAKVRQGRGETRPRSLALPGLTLYWGRARRGNRVMTWKPAKARLSRPLKSLNPWGRSARHAKGAWQHYQLVAKLRGHDVYYLF